MRTAIKKDPVERLLRSLVDCMTPECARQMLQLKPDPQLVARVEKLGNKSNAGTLTEREQEEYERYVRYGTLLDIIHAKARLLLKNGRSVA